MANKINFQKEMDFLLQSLCEKNETPHLMLHSCCAPCSSYVIEYLSDYFYITVFYYNPNIYPDEEYALRSAEQKRYISEIKTKYPVEFLEGAFDKESFYRLARGLENEPECGERCKRCYALRLEKTAQQAVAEGADYFATTLTISPLKKAEDINKIGQELSEKYTVKYLASDFKKKNGFKRSTELSNIYGMYRQSYCGCIFSQKGRN
ncbi:MAG: epoxyqueuosine reductase QueH [Acutalibacteraceae bacterium]